MVPIRLRADAALRASVPDCADNFARRVLTRLPTAMAAALLAGCAATPAPLTADQIARLNAQADRQMVRQLQAVHARRMHALRLAIEARRRRAELLARPKTAPELRHALRNGVYSCELKRQVEVIAVEPNGRGATLKWNDQFYQMTAVQAKTGAVRLEDSATGLVWISIIGKSMLLDTRKGKQLANECNLADAT